MYPKLNSNRINYIKMNKYSFYKLNNPIILYPFYNDSIFIIIKYVRNFIKILFIIFFSYFYYIIIR